MPRRVKHKETLKQPWVYSCTYLKGPVKAQQWRVYCNEESTAYSRLERALLRTFKCVNIHVVFRSHIMECSWVWPGIWRFWVKIQLQCAVRRAEWRVWVKIHLHSVLHKQAWSKKVATAGQTNVNSTATNNSWGEEENNLDKATKDTSTEWGESTFTFTLCTSN